MFFADKAHLKGGDHDAHRPPPHPFSGDSRVGRLPAQTTAALRRTKTSPVTPLWQLVLHFVYEQGQTQPAARFRFLID